MLTWQANDASRNETTNLKDEAMTTAELNTAAAILGTNDKTTVFAMCIKTLVEAGIDHKTAFDRVMGAGSFEQFAGDLYDALQAR